MLCFGIRICQLVQRTIIRLTDGKFPLQIDCDILGGFVQV